MNQCRLVMNFEPFKWLKTLEAVGLLTASRVEKNLEEL